MSLRLSFGLPALCREHLMRHFTIGSQRNGLITEGHGDGDSALRSLLRASASWPACAVSAPGNFPAWACAASSCSISCAASRCSDCRPGGSASRGSAASPIQALFQQANDQLLVVAKTLKQRQIPAIGVRHTARRAAPLHAQSSDTAHIRGNWFSAPLIRPAAPSVVDPQRFRQRAHRVP